MARPVAIKTQVQVRADRTVNLPAQAQVGSAEVIVVLAPRGRGAASGVR
jgi:ribosomal protein S5